MTARELLSGSRTRSGPAFELPDGLVATAPPETRGVPRDRVRMLVASPDAIAHRVVADLPRVLRPGDLLVLNTSDTLPAALGGVTADGERVEVHLSTLDPSTQVIYPAALAATRSRWVVEVREPGPPGGTPSAVERIGTIVHLTGGAVLDVGSRYAPGSRLWTAELHSPSPLRDWLAAHGQPVRYPYISAPWPLQMYRTDHADTPGSAEMPSAGRPLTRRVLRRLAGRGVETASLVLHTGVSSLEPGEPPYAEWFTVPPATVRAVRRARRVIAVGTTVVRALESAAGEAASGWTDLVITPERGCPRWTGCSPDGTSRGRRTCSCSRRSPVRGSSPTPTPRRCARATAGTSSATPTCCSWGLGADRRRRAPRGGDRRSGGAEASAWREAQAGGTRLAVANVRR